MSCQLSAVVMFCCEHFFLTPLLPAGPGPNQEELRRRVENGVKEFWYFVRSEVKKLATVEPSERQKYADTLLQDLGHQERWACRLLNAWEITTSGNVRMVWKTPLKIHGKNPNSLVIFSGYNTVTSTNRVEKDLTVEFAASYACQCFLPSIESHIC